MARHEQEVRILSSADHGVIVTDACLGMGIARSRSTAGVSYALCVGSMGCSCPYKRDTCKHLQAMATKAPLTHEMRAATADYIVASKLLAAAPGVNSLDKGLLHCRSLVHGPSEHTPDETINILSGFCSCRDWASNSGSGGVCCHLLAAARHPAFAQHCSEELLQRLAASVASPVPAVQRRGLQCLAAGVEEPLGSDIAAECAALMAVNEEGRAAATAASQARANSAAQTRFMRFLSRGRRVVGQVPDEALDAFLDLVEPQMDVLVAAKPAFLAMQVAPGSEHYVRQQTDNVVKPLNSSRRKRQKGQHTAQAEGADEALPPDEAPRKRRRRALAAPQSSDDMAGGDDEGGAEPGNSGAEGDNEAADKSRRFVKIKKAGRPLGDIRRGRQHFKRPPKPTYYKRPERGDKDDTPSPPPSPIPVRGHRLKPSQQQTRQASQQQTQQASQLLLETWLEQATDASQQQSFQATRKSARRTQPPGGHADYASYSSD